MKKIWQDKKHWGPFPFSFTRYSVSEDRFFTEIGLLSKDFDEIYLFRILDVKAKISFSQKIFGTGTVTLYSSDRSQPNIEIKNIKRPLEVKEMISKMALEQRRIHRVMEINSSQMDLTDSDGDGFPDFID